MTSCVAGRSLINTHTHVSMYVNREMKARGLLTVLSRGENAFQI